MKMSEKTLPAYSVGPSGPLPFQSASPWARRRPYLVLALILAGLVYHLDLLSSRPCPHTTAALEAAKCPKQPDPLSLGKDWDILHDDVYADLAVRRLAQAVQHRTESFDDFGELDPTDPAYDKFFAFSSYLEDEFPKVYSALEHESVNTHGHLYTWKGKDTSKQPVLLMAHVDTVPVNPDTIDQWTYPPFEGQESENATASTPGKWIWGRGASDCKNSVMGILGSVERLVTEGYEPERTILIAFGFDEEIGGFKGAQHLAGVIEERYGQNGVAFLVDEGFSGLEERYGGSFFSMGMAEKGASTFSIKVETPGGHSSVPPTHTGIGIMAQLLVALEEQPPQPSLSPESPLLKYLSCVAEYAPDTPRDLRRKVKNPKAWKQLAKELAKSDRIFNSFLSTTQAIDIIHGGVKTNALPESVEAKVNHRISFTSSVNETKEHFLSVLTPLAHKLNFTISPFDGSPKKSDKHITISVSGSGGQGELEPAPITEPGTPSFNLLASTVRHLFGNETIVSPIGMFANTDTKHMWNLTKNIFRVTPAAITGTANVHTVDERISLEAHLNTTRFYYQLIQNTEGWESA